MEKQRVLVAEDYEDVRTLYEECLERAGFDVLSATNGADAIERAMESSPHAVLMDLQMPEVDGWEAIRRIRALRLDRRPYILAITAHIGEGSRVDAYEAGADDFVAKPISPDMICQILHAALKPGNER